MSQFVFFGEKLIHPKRTAAKSALHLDAEKNGVTQLLPLEVWSASLNDEMIRLQRRVRIQPVAGNCGLSPIASNILYQSATRTSCIRSLIALQQLLIPAKIVSWFLIARSQ